MRQTLSDYDDRDEGFTLLSEAREPEQAAPPPDRRLPKIILSAGAMAVFAGGLYFAYVQGTHHASTGTTTVAQSSDGVPILRADPQPTKVKPDQPGGMNVPDQNVSLYNDKPGAAPVEKLLPGPEKVMPRPAPPPPPPPPPPAAALPLQPAAPAPTPVGTQTAPVKPNEKIAAKPKPAPADKQATLEKPLTEPKAPAAKQPATPKAETTPAAKGTGPIQVRLASMRTPEEAKEEWAKLKRENSDILGNLRAVAVRTDLGDKGIYYRIEAGPFADTAAAEKICSEMKRRNFGCILAR